MKTAVVVQARVGSSRLPGKVLKPLGPRTVLEEVLRRCAAVPGAGIVVCAIPDGAAAEPIARLAQAAGAVVVRGPEADVRARYLLAADAVGADIVLRVTSDCPLIDPELCAAVLATRAAAGADYCANNMPPSFPHGLDCEAFTTPALRRAVASDGSDDDREHVTPWLRRSEGISRAALVGPGGAFAGQRWTLDWPEDLDFLRAAVDLAGERDHFVPWFDLAARLAARPDLLAINSVRQQAR
ncbi:MAG: glycosyltransferase family protein [Rhodospirillales bacterium]|nr:glycosyltransferase family protein [Rhodospirillales bacterium]